jgi:hypothetical protein
VTWASAVSSARRVAGGRITSSKLRRGAIDSTARRPPMPNKAAKGFGATRVRYQPARSRGKTPSRNALQGGRTPVVYARRVLTRLAGILLCALLLGWGQGAGRSAHGAACTTIGADTIDDCVRLNQIQVLGTHNSYHVAPPPPVLERLGERGDAVNYTHRPLAEQLSRLNIRKLEIDVFADPDGGRFARPAALRLVEGLEPVGPELQTPGFKVLHNPDLDYRTTCSTLKGCLMIVRDWSRANPWHVPIMIMIEAKDSPMRDPDGIGFVAPLPIGPLELRALDDEIRSVFSRDHVLTPDGVRGGHRTLAAAVAADGWPSLRASRGKVLFALDNTDQHRLDYLRGNPSLEGRMLFVSSGPGEPSAAFLKMNDALADEAAIRDRVREGFLIRTRADIPNEEARTGSTARRDRAFRSGAHYVSTDYPETSPFGSGYRAVLPDADGLPARCNPVNAPAGCRSEWLERRPAR